MGATPLVLDGFCLSTAVAGAGVVQRYLVQIIVESAFSESTSVREDFCRSRLEKHSFSADDIWLDAVEVSSTSHGGVIPSRCPLTFVMSTFSKNWLTFKASGFAETAVVSRRSRWHCRTYDSWSRLRYTDDAQSSRIR